MALSWRTQREFPFLPDYATASKREADTKPIRGDAWGLKPLGRRDQKHHAIWRMPNGDIYATRGYYNPLKVDEHNMRWGHILCVWKPDDTILLGAPAYGQKQVECEIFDALFHTTFTSRYNALWAHTRNAGDVKLHALIEDNRFVFNVERGGLETISVRPQTTHAINRKGMAEVRKRYAGFRTYCSAMSKLIGDGMISMDERKRVMGVNEYGGVTFMRLPGQWGWSRNEQFRILAAHIQSDDTEDQYYAWMHLTLGGSDINKVYDNVLMAMHPDECLITKEHTDGKIRKDQYAWVFV